MWEAIDKIDRSNIQRCCRIAGERGREGGGHDGRERWSLIRCGYSVLNITGLIPAREVNFSFVAAP